MNFSFRPKHAVRDSGVKVEKVVEVMNASLHSTSSAWWGGGDGGGVIRTRLRQTQACRCLRWPAMVYRPGQVLCGSLNRLQCCKLFGCGRPERRSVGPPVPGVGALAVSQMRRTNRRKGGEKMLLLHRPAAQNDRYT